MDWIKLRTYSGKRKAQKNKHCGSPVPGVIVPGTVGRKNAPRQCLDLLSKRRRQTSAKRQIGSVSAKTLPAIQETSNVDCFSAEQSVELNYNDNAGMNMSEKINEIDSNTPQSSVRLNLGSRESLGTSETSSELTLPTGVSDFLLQCLDSSIDANTESSDGTNNYSSPETFRDGSDLEETCDSPKEYFGCKNSTLLDTSKAISVNKIPSLSDFSKIFENTLESQVEHLPSDTLSKSKQFCESTDVSTTVAGKRVYKILSSKEKTPKSQPSETLVLPPKQSKLLDNQQSRKMKFRKTLHFKSFLETTASSSSSVALSSTALKTPVQAHRIIDGDFALEEPDADMYLRHPPEICSIVKASPEFRPLKSVQQPLRQISFPPQGIPADIITNDRNWICSNDS
ncbi:meiosis-specific kinetochore protein isoform X2 [Sphaerodactylus townsendi]|uniref:meiosis-specific kinetochore protein isoform X2 n=1 Tax=Sphaerodactylus townsendi TaxID=933632 RepID=UPI002026DC14|nr:meiosis-specific kinetochore protein isoform X2 [Sphaerodactylus townsendi]